LGDLLGYQALFEVASDQFGFITSEDVGYLGGDVNPA
jgi:hypothetical protein